MHTLALDIGNTAVKAGCFDGSTLREMATGLTAGQVREMVTQWQPQHVIAVPARPVDAHPAAPANPTP
jgi:type III pantothenate kinase